MSNIERFENVKQIILKTELDFNKLAQAHGAVNFTRESAFAIQILQGNKYLAQVAMENQDSLIKAVINVAAVGLTLSPAQRLAYLVPRERAVCLDISYMGYIHLATECGGILWAQAEIVKEKDTFIFKGMGIPVKHEFDPFGDRGQIVGAYCQAKTASGDYLSTMMSLDEIYKIRESSQSYQAHLRDKSKTSPWVTSEAEMMKKTVVKRAWKMWPRVRGDRMDHAIEVDAQDVSEPQQIHVAMPPGESEKQLIKIRELLMALGRTEAQYIEHLTKIYRRTIKGLEDLTEHEANQSIVFLQSLLKEKK